MCVILCPVCKVSDAVVCSCSWKCCPSSRLCGMARCRNTDCIMPNWNRECVLFTLSHACICIFHLYLVEVVETCLLSSAVTRFQESSYCHLLPCYVAWNTIHFHAHKMMHWWPFFIHVPVPIYQTCLAWLGVKQPKYSVDVQVQSDVLRSFQKLYLSCETLSFITTLHLCIAVLAMSNMSVSPSMCLSNAWTVIKQKKLMSTFLYHMKDWSS